MPHQPRDGLTEGIGAKLGRGVPLSTGRAKTASKAPSEAPRARLLLRAAWSDQPPKVERSARLLPGHAETPR